MNDLRIPITKNAPKVHPLVANGFLFVNTAGMRLAPETLILEMYREVFFERHYEEVRSRELNPNLEISGEAAFSRKERAAIFAMRGRTKATKQSRGNVFYAPAYPELASFAWLRKNSDRVVRNFLFWGAMAQYGKGLGTTADENALTAAVTAMVDALLGAHRCDENDDVRGKDILAVALRRLTVNGSQEMFVNRVRDAAAASKTAFRTRTRDPLAQRIVQDLMAVCRLESTIPRRQWILVLMSFLRLALPIWVLAHMRLTVLVHEWLIASIDGGRVIEEDDIMQKIGTRHMSLLRPSLTPTRELFEAVERYIRSRIELDIALYGLEVIRPELLGGKVITTCNRSSGMLSLTDLFDIAHHAKDDLLELPYFRTVGSDLSLQQCLVRRGEEYAAWRDPLNKGQGKNLDEFLRVLYKAAEGDEGGGYLLIRERKGIRVFPGQLLLQTMTYLASMDKYANSGTRGAGRFMLSDLEDHLREYGIDFSEAADARPRLIGELQRIGLLLGSPDAGDSVQVSPPYDLRAVLQ